MKVFFTPAIKGQYDETVKVQLPNEKDDKVYSTVKSLIGQDGIDSLDRDGRVKLIERNARGNITGYVTYVQDDF
jgi:hypothetical protein